MTLTFLNDEFLTDLGIVDWGYTETSVPTSVDKYNSWVDLDQHGILNYLADHRKDKRQDLKEFFPEFQSALVFVFPYWDQRKMDLENSQNLKISSFVTAFEGKDYHHVLKKRLNTILEQAQSEHVDLSGVFTIDAQPVLERDLAHRAGLGWFGKNSMLINKDYGSYFLIASILLNQKFTIAQKTVDVDHCGSCTSCIEACPTNAIDPDTRTLIADKCISTFTIEQFKTVDPPLGFENANNEVFGCDICQDICPWNQKQLFNITEDYQEPLEAKKLKEFFNRSIEEILKSLDGLSNRAFRREFAGTSLERTGRVGLIKNIKSIKKDHC